MTTYQQSNLPFVGNAAQRYPIKDLSQFVCRGLYFNDDNIEFFMQGAGKVLFSQSTPALVAPGTMTVTGFTLPQQSTPGTFAFDWSVKDSDGVVLATGSCVGTWMQFAFGGYYHPKLLTNSLTVN